MSETTAQTQTESTEIMKLERLSNKSLAIRNADKREHLQILERIGKLAFESKLFGDLQNAAAGFMKAMAGDEVGLAPFISMNGFHIIKGKVTMGANLQAMLVKRSGYVDYDVIQHDASKCVIEWYKKHRITGEWRVIGTSEFSVEQATAAGLAGPQGQNKDVWRRYPMNMTFARAITNGVKWHCPEILGGIQSAAIPDIQTGDVEHLEEFIVTGEGAPQQIQPPAANNDTVTPEVVVHGANVATDKTDNSDAIDAEEVEPEAPAPAAAAAPASSAVEALRAEISEKLMTLTDGDIDAADKILKGRVIIHLTEEALAKLLNELAEIELKQQ